MDRVDKAGMFFAPSFGWQISAWELRSQHLAERPQMENRNLLSTIPLVLG